jgi:hypothetical protein
MMRRLLLSAWVVVIFCECVTAQSQDPGYYQPYVIPVSFAGNYLKVEYGGLMGSNLPAPEAYTFGMLNQMLQGTYKPKFKSIASFEMGWSFPKTKISNLEQRRFGVTGDISLKALKAPFDLKGPSDKNIKATYTKAISAYSFGAGLNLNYRFMRKHFVKVGLKVYPTLLMSPDMFVQITTPNATNEANSSRSVITAGDQNPVKNGMIGKYDSKATGLFTLQYAYAADVILFKKLIVGIGYHHAVIDADYTYYNDSRNSFGQPTITKKTFKANLNYSHIALRAGFYFSRGYK